MLVLVGLDKSEPLAGWLCKTHGLMIRIEITPFLFLKYTLRSFQSDFGVSSVWLEFGCCDIFP